VYIQMYWLNRGCCASPTR